MSAGRLVAGFGFRAAAGTDSLRDALIRAAAGHPLGALVALATAADKVDSPALAALARELDLPVLAIPAEALATRPTVTRSPAVQRRRGTGSVAEAAALAGATGAAGGGAARLVDARAVSADRMACCALAQGGLT